MKKIWKVLIIINILIWSLCACNVTVPGGETGSDGKETGSHTAVSEKDVSIAAVQGDTVQLSPQTNETYPYCNSRSLYVCTDGIIKQYTLEGEYIRSYEIDKDFSLLYVNEEEMIVLNMSQSLCSIPIEEGDGRDILDIEGMTELLVLSDGGTSGYIWPENLYADTEHLVYITNDGSFRVYDRKKKKYIAIKNDPKSRHFFYDGSVRNSTDGEYVVFVAGYNGASRDGLFLYHAGDDFVTQIDKNCSPLTSFLFWDTEHKVIYASDAKAGKGQTIWGYDCKTHKKEALLPEDKLAYALGSLEDQGTVGEKTDTDVSGIYLDGNILYIELSKEENTVFLKYDLMEFDEVEILYRLNQNIEAIKSGKKSDEIFERYAFIEGKCLMSLESSDEEDYQYICFDLDRDTYQYVTEDDAEKIYFQSIGLWVL